MLFALLDWFTTGRKRFVVPTGAIVIPDRLVIKQTRFNSLYKLLVLEFGYLDHPSDQATGLIKP
jgi:hypothetical protein